MCHSIFLAAFKGPFESVGFLLWELYVLTVRAILPPVNFIDSQRQYSSFFLFLSECPFFELSALDRSHFRGSFSLKMFLRMFLNFNNGNLITLKLEIDMKKQ